MIKNLFFLNLSGFGTHGYKSLSLKPGSRSASATTDALRASYVTAATYGVAALPVQTFFSFTIGAVGWLFWSLVMLKGVFPRWTAIFGIIVNVMGILGGVGAVVQETPYYLLGLFTIFGAIFTAFWFIVVGAQLYRRGSRLSSDVVKV